MKIFQTGWYFGSLLCSILQDDTKCMFLGLAEIMKTDELCLLKLFFLRLMFFLFCAS